MKDTLAHVLERKCNLKVSEAKKLAACARQNLELPQTFLWSKELEKEAIRLCYEQNPRLAEEENPKTMSVHTEEPSKDKERHPKIVSPRRRCQKQGVATVGKTDVKSPIKKKKRTCSSQDFANDVVQDVVQEPGVWAKQEVEPSCLPSPEPTHEVDLDEDDERYLTEKTVPSLLPPLRTDSYCTVDSLFSSDSIQDDFAHASDWSSWLRKNDKWSTLRSSKRVPKILDVQRGDAGPRVPVRRKSYDDDDFEFVMRGV